MWIMNLVWPITALYFGPIALWAYFAWAGSGAKAAMMHAKMPDYEHHAAERPFWQKCAVGTSHCGSGCTRGDILLFQRELPKTSPVFWFMMQIAMIFGFATGYPVNWILIKRGLKEKM